MSRLCRLLIACLLLPALSWAQDSQPAAPEQTSTDVAIQSAAPRVQITTSLGDIVVELYPDKAPKTVANFLGYVDSGFYDGTIFHRVIDNFLIQGGLYTPDLHPKPTLAPVPNEANNGLSNLRGTLVAARGSEPNSATSQFFINLVDNPRLDYISDQNDYTWGYAVFGKVVEGMEVVDAIRGVETGPQGPFRKDVPIKPVIIEHVLRIPSAPAAPQAGQSENSGG